MPAFNDAKTALETSITENRTLLGAQDVQATLDATFNALVNIRKAANQWARALISLKAIAANTDAEILAAVNDPVVQEIRQLAGKLAEDIGEVKTGVQQIAEKARSLPT